MISKVNQVKRVDVARNLLNLEGDHFRRIIWSDETSVKARPDYRKITYFQRSYDDLPDLIVNRQVQSGGFNVIFWGCFSYHAMGPLVALNESITTLTFLHSLRTISYWNGLGFTGMEPVPSRNHLPTGQCISLLGQADFEIF